ncbi:Mannosylfructose-phosphate synthase [Fuerstiella marisgermanici]|uniref:Mannosylfructose-phosphate synthase n=1 Tax=Fuerstiella marisgermanici TaxID=1891926 RepID=A0A1P8W957_9PLAN|nr:Mannosylfructose-phosphate synthase [Fuerstiella marisgermanici]
MLSNGGPLDSEFGRPWPERNPLVQSLTIAQLVPQLHNGGVERGTLEINRALVAAGHRSIVISGGGQMVTQLECEGGEHVEMQIWKKSPRTLRSVGQLRRWMQQVKPDAVHARSRIPAWVTWLAWRKLPVPTRPRYLTTVHGLNRPNAYSRIMTSGERVIAVSNTCRDVLLKNYPGVDPQKITVVHRGVDPTEFPYGYQPSSQWLTNWYQQYPQLKGQFVACVPGRVTRLKGHFDFLKALRILADRDVKVCGVIAGGEDPRRKIYACELRAMVEDLQLQDRIVFTGHRSDIRDVIVACDAVISTTAEPPESFGRAVLESVRLGKITLGYNHGGVGEVLSTVFPDGLIPLRDIAALADRLQAAKAGNISLPTENSSFLLEKMQSDTLKIYHELCSESRHA